MTLKDSAFQTIPDLPSELTGPLPRRIQLSRNSNYLPIVLALLIGITVITGFLYGKHVVNLMQQRSALHQDGVEVQGEITSLKRAGRGPEVVRYTFTANGGTVSGMADMPFELVQSFEESTVIKILYLPSNPAINHPAAWEWSLSSEWLVIFILICPPTLFIVMFTSIYRKRKLLIWGKPVTGIVTNCRVSGRGRISIEYEFRTETGAQVRGSGNSPVQQKIGACICVLYLPQNPRRNLPYPVPDFYVDADASQ
jgi:hypothetical protein